MHSMNEGKKYTVALSRARDEGASFKPVIADDKLQVARILYRIMVHQYPDRLVMLCDDQARMQARSDRPETMPPLN